MLFIKFISIVDEYSKLCFISEYHAAGMLLESKIFLLNLIKVINLGFSTSSTVEISNSFYIPKVFRGIYLF